MRCRGDARQGLRARRAGRAHRRAVAGLGPVHGRVRAAGQRAAVRERAARGALGAAAGRRAPRPRRARRVGAPGARAHRGGRVSDERARSFGSVAEDYEATRPGWPVEPFALAFEQFGLPDRPDVVDVAAGTGKLTRTLAEISGTLVAVEPDPVLRAVLERQLPDVTALDGTAEELPLETASADAACAGQAFHWFDLDLALDEFARVLRPRGIAIAAWNSPPEAGTWYDAVIEFLTSANP